MRRVVVTGMGVLSPIGHSVDTFWQSLMDGTSGIARITHFDPSDFKTQIAAEVKDFNPEPILDAREARRLDLFSQYGIWTSVEAVESSGLSITDEDPFRVGSIMASGIGGINVLEQQVEVYLSKGPSRVSPFYITGMISDIVAGHLGMKYGIMGPNYVTTSACASAAHAIGSAYHAIMRDDADIMITGGTEGAISPTAIAGFINIHALSRRNDEPERACRPCDKDHDGFVMGEGSGVLVLEELEHAIKRGANILAEIGGAGFTADGHHITDPHPEGIGASKAMEIAIARSGKTLDDVDYINLHSPSTPAGDIAETKSIKHLFGEKAYGINLSSTKSMHGHLLGAAGAVELIATILAVKNDIIPPTINHEEPDPACDLNYTPNKPVKRTVGFALSNSFGFGGHNASVAVKKYVEE